MPTKTATKVTKEAAIREGRLRAAIRRLKYRAEDAVRDAGPSETTAVLDGQ